MTLPTLERAGLTRRRSAGSARGRLLLYAATWTVVGLLSVIVHGAALEVGGTLPAAAMMLPVLFWLTAWPVLRRYLVGREWATIANGVLLLIFVYFGIGCAVYIIAYDSITLAALRAPAFAAPAMAAGLLGAACYRLGAEGPWFTYAAHLLPPLPRTPRWSPQLRLGVFTCIAVAMLVNLYLMRTGNFGYRVGGEQRSSGTLSILNYIAGLGKIALVIGCYYWFNGAPLRVAAKGLLVAATVVMMMAALISGMKEAVLEILIFVGVTYVVTGHRLRLTIVTPAVVLVLALFALNSRYRTALALAGTHKDRISASVEALALMDRPQAGSRSGILGEGSEQLLRRVSLFSFMLPAIEKTPSVYDYRNWDRYPELIPTAIIPRIVWPEKPVQELGADFNAAYISNSPNSTTPTTIGWAYLEDGFVGVGILMAVLGAAAGLIQVYTLRRHGPTLPAVVLFAVSFRLLFQLEGDPYWILNGLIKQIVVAALTYSAIVYLPRLVSPRRYPRVQQSHSTLWRDRHLL